MDAKYLSEINGMEIHEVTSEKFKTFGKVVSGIDFSVFENYMNGTEIPADGNVYVPSAFPMETLEVASQIQNEIYGGMPIQIGYCNGKNSTYNGFEYHKCSEINYAVTDYMLVLGHVWDMVENKYNSDDATVFFVPKGTAFEFYQTTLHLAPCKTADDGFKAVIVLAKGTNTMQDYQKPQIKTLEGDILHLKNKWIICHKDRAPLVSQGVRQYLQGENKELKY